MNSIDILAMCGVAFIAVFLLLMILALIMRLILVVFPERAEVVDAAVLAAVTSVISTAYPGTKITKVEEVK